MTKKLQTSKDAAAKVVKNIRRKTRQTYSAEEKIRIVLAGLRGEESISVLCRREGIAESLYYSWSKEFLEAGKRRLSGDTARQAASPEVKDLRSESLALKECVADLTLENRLLKKSITGAGEFHFRQPASYWTIFMWCEACCAIMAELDNCIFFRNACKFTQYVLSHTEDDDIAQKTSAYE